MDRERANRTSIHLYCGPYWVAFERSAYQLSHLPGSRTPLRHCSYPFPIVMVSVTDRSLRSYARKHILRRDETDYVVLTVPESSLTDYRRWHAGEVEGLPADMNQKFLFMMNLFLNSQRGISQRALP